MDKEKSKSVRQMLIIFAAIIIVILIAVIPKPETFVCIICENTVTQIPKVAPASLTGIHGYDYTNFELDDRDKMCDECYELIDLYLENESN